MRPTDKNAIVLDETWDILSVPNGMRAQFYLLMVVSSWVILWVAASTRRIPNGLLPFNYYAIEVILPAVFLTFIVSVVTLYMAHPLAISKSFGGRTPADERTSLGRRIRHISKLAQRNIRTEISQSMVHQDAVAYGYPGRRIICFGGGLHLVERKKQHLADALIAHEISHITNADIDYGHLSRAIGGALGIVGLLGTLLMAAQGAAFIHYTGAYRDVLIDLAIFILGIAIFFGIARVTAATGLRQRELLADFASTRLVPVAHVREVVGLVARTTSRQGSVFLRLFSFHPTAAKRLRCLDSHAELLLPSASEIVVSGIFFGFSLCFWITTLINSYGILPLQRGSITDVASVATAFDYVAANVGLILTLVSIYASLVVTLIAIAALNLRTCFAFGLGLIDVPQLLYRSMTTLGLAIAGIVTGELINPITVRLAAVGGTHLAPDDIGKILDFSRALVSYPITALAIGAAAITFANLTISWACSMLIRRARTLRLSRFANLLLILCWAGIFYRVASLGMFGAGYSYAPGTGDTFSHVVGEIFGLCVTLVILGLLIFARRKKPKRPPLHEQTT